MHRVVYPVNNIADALDWPSCLLHSYGFMRHHHGISFAVDYNSQKPLIKQCIAKALFKIITVYLWTTLKPIDLLTKSPSAVLRTNRPSTPLIDQPQQIICSNVCLLDAVFICLVFLLNGLLLFNLWEECVFSRPCWLWWLCLVFW